MAHLTADTVEEDAADLQFPKGKNISKINFICYFKSNFIKSNLKPQNIHVLVS